MCVCVHFRDWVGHICTTSEKELEVVQIVTGLEVEAGFVGKGVHIGRTGGAGESMEGAQTGHVHGRVRPHECHKQTRRHAPTAKRCT